MAATNTQALTYDKDDKREVDVHELEVKQPVGEAVDVKVDYSGFTQKTDPAEIKLVRKLDCFIMVSPPTLCAMLR